MADAATRVPGKEWTRRDWLKAGGLAAASGAAGLVVGTKVLAPLLGPPTQPSGEVREDFVYTQAPSSQWWDDLVGQPARVTDFGEWEGASAIWRGLFRHGAHVPGTGFPVLVIRVKRDDTHLEPPPPFLTPPTGFEFFYDDPNRDLRIVVVSARCTHLCCYTGWHTLPPEIPPLENYFRSSPTREVYGEVPIYCICHDAQFDPLVFGENWVVWGSFSYLGIQAVGGPARHGLPVVPVKAVNDVLFGGMGDPRWYAYCGSE